MRILTTLLLCLSTFAAHAQTAPLPEPSTVTLLGVAAVAGIAAAIARKRRK